MDNKNKQPNFKNYYKNHQKKLKEEENKGREVSTNKSKKITDEYNFKTMLDDDLYNNNELMENILKKLQICTNKDCKNIRCNNFFYLYTNKKVGSTCLWGSINLYLSNFFKTFHYHNIGDLEREEIYGISINQLFKILKIYNKNVIVVDIYRPIFDICVSNYFNDINIHFQRDFDLYPEFENKDTFIHRFLNLFEHYYEKHDIDYFIDEYNIPNSEKIFTTFNFTDKHLVYKDDSITYIKLRLCDSIDWNKILYKYIEKDFKIIKYNESKNKSWGKYYDYFNENFFITTEMYDKIKNNKYFKFYYTEEEQEKYLLKFTNRINDTNVFGFKKNEISLYYSIINKNEIKQILSHLSLESNSPICNNCECSNCITIRNNILINLNKNTNINPNINTNINPNININPNMNKNSIILRKKMGFMNFSK